MELFAGLSDDMTAVCGCVVAFLLCGSLMSLSHFVGRRREMPAARRPVVEGRRTDAPATATGKGATRPAPRKRAA